MMFKNKYRIVSDCYRGYEVQIMRWHSLIWVQCSGLGRETNSHYTIEEAEAYAMAHSNKFVVIKEFYP